MSSETDDKANIMDMINRFIDWLIRNRITITMWLFVLGFAMIFLSWVIGIFNVEFNGQLKNGYDVFTEANGNPIENHVSSKQVGYFPALNWSLFVALIAPLIVFFAISTLQSFKRTLVAFCESGMARDDGFNRVDTGMILAKWQAQLNQNRFLFAAIFAAVMYFTLYDWWSVVGWPITHPEPVNTPITDFNMDYDWSVASLYKDSNVSAIQLFIFGLFGYIIFAGLIPALTISVTVCTLTFMLFISTLHTDKSPVHFAAIPSPTLKDRHFGFKLFSDLFHNFLMMSLLVLIGLWLMSIQNVYLRDTEYTDIYRFLLGDTKQLGMITKGDFSNFIPWLKMPAERFYYNIQVAASGLLYPFICLLGICGCWFILGAKAREAQDYSLKNAEKLAGEFNMSRDVLVERLSNEMEFWPVGWIKSRQLLFFMFLMACSMISYRVIALPIAIIGTITIVSEVKKIIGLK